LLVVQISRAVGSGFGISRFVTAVNLITLFSSLTRVWDGWPRNRGSICCTGREMLLLSAFSKPVLESVLRAASFPMVPEDCCRCSQCPEGEFHRSVLSDGDVRNVWSCSSFPPHAYGVFRGSSSPLSSSYRLTESVVFSGFQGDGPFFRRFS
jgi:hypothetical protein